MRRTLALLLIAAILAAGCTKSAAPPQGTTAPVTIRLGYTTDTNGLSELDPVIAAFQNRFPAYRVEKVALPNDDEGLARALANGDADLFPGAAHLYRPMQTGAVADLTPYLHTQGFNPGALDWFLSKQEFQGRILDLPYYVDPAAVLYNRDLAAASGVTIPRDGWTWDQFRDIAQRLTNQDKGIWGFEAPVYPWLVIVWASQAAGPPLGRPSRESVPDALRYFAGAMFTDRSFQPPPDPRASPASATGPATGPGDIAFQAGQAVMTVEPLPAAQGGPTFAWEAAPIPNLPGARPVLFVKAHTLAMSSHAPNPDGAWQFLKFLLGPDGAMLLATQGYLPCYQDEAAKLAWLKARPDLPQSVQSLLDTQWVTMSWYLTNHTRDGLIFATTVKALAGAANWEPAAAEYVKRAQDERIE